MGKIILLLLLSTIFTFSQSPLISPIVVDKSNTILDGKNISYKLADNKSSPMIIVGDSKNIEPEFMVENIVIKNFILDGNMSAQPSEIWNNVDNGIRASAIVIRKAKNVVIQNCIIRNARSAGICIEKSSESVIIENCIIETCFFDGIAGCYSTNNIIRNNVVKDCMYAGISFDLQFNNNRIEGNVLINNDIGVFMRFSDYNTFTGNVLKNKTFDFYFNKTNDDVFTIPKFFKLKDNVSTSDSIFHE